MSYWICLVRPEPGMTALQTIECTSAQFDIDAFDVDAPPPAVELTEAQAAAWQRICVRFLQLVTSADRDEFPSHVEIASHGPRIRLEYDGASATITIPYWYDGDEAEDALATAYAIGRVVEEETGLVGVDSQTSAELTSERLKDAASLYRGTRTSSLGAIRGSH